MNFSSKIPYVDDDFILLNIRQSDALRLFSGNEQTATRSHFEADGGRHASLLSFFEARVPYGALHVYSDGSDCQDRFGDHCHFRDSSYLYSHQHGFLSAAPESDARLHALRAAWLRERELEGNPIIDAYIQSHASALRSVVMRDGVPTLRRTPFVRLVNALTGSVKRRAVSVNYEFQKKYD